MEKNTVWAVILSVLVLLVWYKLFPPGPPVQKSASPAVTDPIEEPGTLFSSDSKSSKTSSSRESSKRKSYSKVTERVLETEELKITVHSNGASVKHWEIKGEKFPVDLVNRYNDDGEEFEVTPKSYGLSTYSDLNFREVKTRSRKGLTQESRWEAMLPSGVLFEKTYQFNRDASHGDDPNYFLNLILTFRNPTNSALKVDGLKLGWNGGLGTFETEWKENKSQTRILSYPSIKKEVEELDTGTYPFNQKWGAIDNRYYLLALIPEEGKFDRIFAQEPKKSLGEVQLLTDSMILSPQEVRTYSLKIYGGPKGYGQLKQWGLQLEHSIDFGFFGFLGKSALKLLINIYEKTKNYGWSIIILTIFVKIFLLPLDLKSYKSMAAMKKLQPKMQEIQKRFKDDPKRSQTELMNLYRKEKVSPFGSCLPMLLQMPIFLAFFTLLRNAYELRGAPWVFWIQDLSQKDPYYILPITMGAGMVLQQKLSGPIGDPNQAKIMTFIPIVFTFLFLNFPSGLVLYWLTNSILSMIVQFWTKKRYADNVPAVVTG